VIGLLALAAATMPGDEAVSLQSLQDMGTCIVQEAPRDAREVLAMDFESPSYASRLKVIAAGHPNCLGLARRFSSSGILFAGSLAEALLRPYEKDGRLSDRIGFDPAREAVTARSGTEAMALCTVLYAPKDTAAVLETKPGTREEIAAMEPLGPVLAKCLKKDMKVTLNKPAIRSMLALAAYRVLTTPKTMAAQ
jgi:hypothetical protein